jgi:hypothetical protein
VVNSSGVLRRGVRPVAAIRSFTSGKVMAFSDSAFSRVMASLGVPVGARNPYQGLAS